MSNALSLLQEATQESPNKKVRCQNCGNLCDSDVSICPLCNHRAQLPTIAECGLRLPIGILDDNSEKPKLIKDFTVKKFTWPVEREAAKTWKGLMRTPETKLLDRMVVVIAHCLETLGGVDLGKHSIQKRMNILYEMFAGDIFYMYAYIRIDSIGGEFTLQNVECPHCQHIIKEYPVDLTTLEVGIRESVSEIYQEIELRDGFELLKEVRKKLVVKPPSFRSMCKSDPEDDAQFFSEIFRTAVHKIEGLDSGVVITESELEKMSPYDLALIRGQVDYLSGGPVWGVEVTCPQKDCGNEFDYVIDWRYGTFFKLSSRSRLTPKL